MLTPPLQLYVAHFLAMVGYSFLKVLQFCLVSSVCSNQTTDTHLITNQQLVYGKLKRLNHLLRNDIFRVVVSVIFTLAKTQ